VVVRQQRRRQRDEAVNLRASQYDDGDWGRYLQQLDREE